MATFYYPNPSFEGDKTVKAIRIARHSPCSVSGCSCPGLHPSEGQRIEIPVDFEEEMVFSDATTSCECGHGWSKHGASSRLVSDEFERRARAAVRADEFLEESERLDDFTYSDETIVSLRKQMELPEGEEKDASYLTREDTPDTDMASEASFSPSHKRSRSASSSGLSEIPNVPASKRRRITSTSLSDEDAEDDPDAVVPTTSPVSKVPPVAVLSGARTNARANKKRATGAGAIATKGAPSMNGSTNIPKVRLEDDSADMESLADSTVSAPGEAAPMSIDLPPKEKIVIQEHRAGFIQFMAVQNDGEHKSLIVLTGLKSLFQRQLPKMPREYIARLVMDRNSRGLAMIKHGYRVVAGIMYRPFAHRGFIEIVFCAVSSTNQVKGYGGHLMDHFKKHIQDTYDNVDYFLTYADNYAIGYFKKQGFSKDVTLDRVKWAGYIKDYEGATLLQCTLVPVDYTKIRDILTEQKVWVIDKIQERSSSHVIRPGIEAFQEGNEPTELDYKDIPGLLEAGWTDAPVKDEPPGRLRAPQYVRLTRSLRALQAHPQSWPFRTPVNKADVPDYYDFIKNPMDLHTMQSKLEQGKYTTPDLFIGDVRTIVQNCLVYNPSDSVYAKAALKLRRYFEDVLVKEISEKQEEGSS